ncbi:MAG TPA: TetR/AcrR family transcriptional regulator [Acidimicrobiales bacterium]|nr:TetR/AcrR family transcriptional regulator [Acidimicrobiales bacterium]
MTRVEDPAAAEAKDDPALRRAGRPRDERASQAITEAAMRQLVEVGYANVSMESVATEAGVARATVYRRYRDKADLVTAAIASSAGPIGPAHPHDPKRELAKFLRHFDARFAEQCLAVMGGLIAAREEPHALGLHRERTILPRLRYATELLRRGQELGEIDPDADLLMAVHLMVGAVMAQRASGLTGGTGWVDDLVDWVWAALAPHGT